jgi:regulator of cell morphogenesis and NO signaling
MSKLNSHATVGQLVAERPARSRVFEKWGLDYCCGGKKPLDEACIAKGLNLESIIAELREDDIARSAETHTDWTQASLTELADHIEQRHHGYLREALPRLSKLIEKVQNAHGDTHPELAEVAAVFEELSAELTQHTFKEEMILFPFCRKLDEATDQPLVHCGSIRNPIAVMEHEHEEAGQALARLRELTGDYAVPGGACNTYRAMLDGLFEFEKDLHEHIHKENNILFPRAIEREATLSVRHAA